MRVLVTGGAQGLGRAICLRLARDGHHLVIHYKSSKQEAEVLANECHALHVGAETIYGDFSTEERTRDFLDAYQEHFSETQGIVNNVGNYLIAPLNETPLQEWLALYQTNFFAPLLITQTLLPSICRFNGCIVNIGVSGLKDRAFTETTAYAATKSSLLLYTLSLAKVVANEGVRVNMLSPGYLENAVDLKDAPPLPFKRPATLDEAASLVAYLFSPAGSYITGQNIEIAGGYGL